VVILRIKVGSATPSKMSKIIWERCSGVIWHSGKVGEFVGALLLVGKAEGDELGATEVDGWALDKVGSSDGVSVGSKDGV
jgi:hypothetical protein